MSTIALKVLSIAGTPEVYPGTVMAIDVDELADAVAVWIGVSTDGTTNQAYPITTPLATITGTYPRVYQGVSVDISGSTYVINASLDDINRRLNACCLWDSEGGSSSSSGE